MLWGEITGTFVSISLIAKGILIIQLRIIGKYLFYFDC
jgi:hypothetical protein